MRETASTLFPLNLIAERARSSNGSCTIRTVAKTLLLVSFKRKTKRSFRSTKVSGRGENFSSTITTRRLQTIASYGNKQVSTKQYYSPRSSRRARGRSIRWVSWRCHPSACQSCTTENNMVENPQIEKPSFRSLKIFTLKFFSEEITNSWRRSWLFRLLWFTCYFFNGPFATKVPLQFHIFDRDKKNKTTIQFFNTKSHLKHKDNANLVSENPFPREKRNIKIFIRN